MMVDTVLDVVDISMFGEYAEAFKALLRGDKEDSALMRIVLDDTIRVMSEEELKKSLLVLLRTHYTNLFKSIPKNRDLSYEKKSFLMRKIKTDIIPRLKRGELVVYESDSFI